MTTKMTIEDRLNELGYTLPEMPAQAGNYVPYAKVGNVLHLSGTLPVMNGEITHSGKVGKEQDIESAYKAAQICALNTLVNIKLALGSLDALKRIAFVAGYVNGIEGFADSPAVINGASDLFGELYGEAGKHARAAVAVAGLPKNSTVEIQCIVEF